MTTQHSSPISEIWPELPDSETREALEHLEAYLALVVRIYNRVSYDPAQRAKLDEALSQDEDSEVLTDSAEFSTLQAKVDPPNTIN